MSAVTEKFREVLMSVLPIIVIVTLLHLTLTPLEGMIYLRFLIGAASVIVGLTIFLAGTDLGITPIGENLGKGIASSNKLWVVIGAGLFLGFFISIAEPDLHILADQVNMVTGGEITDWTILIVVSVGIATMMTIGLLRVVYSFPLYKLMVIIYVFILLLAIFTSEEFLAIAFDASGATTGALTVPFMLALSAGVAMMEKNGTNAEKNSFGLVGIASSGAIIGVMALSIFSQQTELAGHLEIDSIGGGTVWGPFFALLPVIMQEIVISLMPILIVFLLYHFVSGKLHPRSFRRILIGVFYVFVGLTLFLTGVNAGFMDVGSVIGHDLTLFDTNAYLLIVAFVLGLITILAEPAVYVLTYQIEDVTNGYVKRPAVLVALSIGVGLAVLLSAIRVLVPSLELWHYLLPGYIIAVGLVFVAPKIFIGMAFDAGGVASGPMTATFILAFIQGVAQGVDDADVLREGFGMIAMVAMMPIITLQILGLIFKWRSQRKDEADVE